MDEDEDIDRLFDWMGDTYQSDNLGQPTSRVDLTQYEITFFHNKEPNGAEYLDPLKVTKIDGFSQS